MRLLSVDIHGFKSFAKQVHVDFRPGITGVIGPNGSGKSNIAEAIRWVLGEQSVKALRAKERSDVIYLGKTDKALRARVTLTFDNSSGRFPVHAPEVAVTRSLTRGGESQYLINNELVRLIDLHQMLAEAGIGTKSYTVISQGTVDQYLTASSQGRRELFDEATGIKSLQIKLGQAQQKLVKTKQHAEEVQTVLSELAPRVTFLKRQIDRYELRETYEKQFRTLQQLWYHHAWHAALQSLEQLGADHAIRLTAIQKARKEREILEGKVRASAQSAQNQEIQRVTYAAWKKERDSLTASLSTTKEALRKAEQLFRTPAPTKQQETWEVRARKILADCKQLIEMLTTGKTADTAALHTIQASLENILNQKEEPTQLAPLTPNQEEITRLRTICEEKQRQLNELQEVPAPEDTATHAAHATLLENLERSRQKEIQEEREESAMLSALEQSRSDLALLEQEILRECGTAALSTFKTSLPSHTAAPSDQELRSLSEKISRIGERDALVEKEYEEAQERYTNLQHQLADIQATLITIEECIMQVSSQIQENFHRQFARIATSFSSYFIDLFGGGSAELVATEDGVDITVAPPKKRARHISLLSGGERALTSLALLLAILDAQEPPFIVLDEVDASLDEANSKRFAALLKSRVQTTQSIIISHNRETMAVADILYGVTMHPDGTSHLYSIKITGEDLGLPVVGT